VFVHILGQYTTNGESRTEPGVRGRTRRILDRGVVINAIAARDSDGPVLRETIWPEGKQQR
jgi:hypothetical protein